MPDDASSLRINGSLSIPLAELTFRATRAGGPGGQHVNTSSTRIEVTWDVAGSPSLTDEQRARLLEKLATRLDQRGTLRLVASERRSQLQNREAALERLGQIVAAALRQPRPRRATRPTKASKERRLAQKRRQGERKRDRRPPPDD